MIQTCNRTWIKSIGIIFASISVLSTNITFATDRTNQVKPVVVADAGSHTIAPNPSNVVKFETITVETSAASALTAEPIQKLKGNMPLNHSQFNLGVTQTRIEKSGR